MSSGSEAARNRLTITDVNTLSEEAFTELFEGIFEASGWVAKRAYASRPFSSLNDMHAAMWRQVEEASPAEQLQLLRAHPDLGSRARMSGTSANEQSRAGLDHLTMGEYTELTALNNKYRDKFGFPFLFAVKGINKLDIMAALRRRLQSTPDAEHQEALAQVRRIAAFRLNEMIMEPAGLA
jgi:OHCU decarboxylase